MFVCTCIDEAMFVADIKHPFNRIDLDDGTTTCEDSMPSLVSRVDDSSSDGSSTSSCESMPSLRYRDDDSSVSSDDSTISEVSFCGIIEKELDTDDEVPGERYE